MEAVRIGGSPPAPLLTVIVSPSEEVAVRSEVRRDLNEADLARKLWWSRLVARPDASLHRHIKPSTTSWIGTTSVLGNLGLNYTVRATDCGAELYIDRGTFDGNRRIFDELHAKRVDIEEAFRGSLSWQRPPFPKRYCRIGVTVDGGYRSPEDEWDAIQARQVDAMNRLHAALKPHIDALPLNALEGAEEKPEAEP